MYLLLLNLEGQKKYNLRSNTTLYEKISLLIAGIIKFTIIINGINVIWNIRRGKIIDLHVCGS